MPELLQNVNEISELIKPYLNQKYFLYIMGSIFLLGIVGQWITKAIYDRLIKKAADMVSPKNKMLRQIKMKFENHKAVNGVVANPTLMVERYINRYKFMGISLGGFAKISNVCAVMCLAIGGLTGLVLYEMNYDDSTAVFCVCVGMFLAFALDIYSRSVRIDIKEGELVCIITDFLENTMNLTERRQDRTAETLQMLAEAEAKNEEKKQKRNVEWYMEEDDSDDRVAELKAIREQEYIINEVLAEFL